MKKLLKIVFTIFLLAIAMNLWFAHINSCMPQMNPAEETVLLDIPVIPQLPELPRGCEVTSLAMMLNHAGIKVDKMELAEKIDKVPFLYKGLKGNPNKGFVGNMYTFDKPGLGVYHKPIVKLADQYLPGKILDLTGRDFELVLYALKKGFPVWVINNSKYNHLSDEFWETWNTDEGKIRITYKEHSVLVTGYDSKYIYFNDPLTAKKNRAVPRENFIKCWKQMGSQAITYVN